MEQKFEKHYTRDEARALLPQIREWLAMLGDLRETLEKNDRKLGGQLASGQDLGGPLVNRSLRLVADMQDVLMEFQRRQIIIKDLVRGLIDFPAFVGDREVFLCWEKDEDDIEYWHDIDAGYAGRERL